MSHVLTATPPTPLAPRGRGAGARRWAGLGLALIVLGLVVAASVSFGAREVSWADIVAGLTGHDDTIAQAAVAKRVPRTVLAVVVGAALGVSGALMQGLTRNPLADPGLLGVTSGASLFVVVAVVFFGLTSPTGYIWVAILGAGVSGTCVYLVGSTGRGGATPLKLALAGAAFTAAFASLVRAILLPRAQVMSSFRFWEIGGVGGASTERTLQVAPFLLVGAVLAVACAGGLNALALGDDLAAGLGENVVRTRVVAALAAVLLCGAATAVAGPIGFVGLVVPHACRLVGGHDHRWLLPCSAVVGAALLTLADVVGRVVARPDEIEVGIVTALVGGPVFIAIVRRQKARAL